jgi:hypothetical protein
MCPGGVLPSVNGTCPTGERLNHTNHIEGKL